MSTWGWGQIVLYVVVLLLLAKPLGGFMAAVYEGRAMRAQRIGGWLERLVYRIGGVDPAQEMDWKKYAMAMLWFNLLGALVVYVLQRLQQWLPLNPQDFAAVSPDSSFNTAVSFATNTNWQGYGGETTMSYLTQMLALAVQNFVSAATGMAVLVALVRGFARKEAAGIGNFWTDLVRSIVYILLPLSIVFAVVLVSQGVPQTFDEYATVTLAQPVTYDNPKSGADGQPLKDDKGNPVTEKVTATEQTIPLGPAASQIAIKQLGTNGGGFYNVNSAHPFENPTPLANLLEALAILLIPASLCYTFGKMLGDTRQGWALLAAMTILFVALLASTYVSEGAGNPVLTNLGADQVATATNPGGNMEGKEVRFGVANSALWAVATTAASNGSVNSMHDSFMPLAGMIPMWLMQLGEVIYGGVGSGLYGMIMFALVTVFIAGLMIGRTPEYLGKKLGAFEIKMASIAILIPPFLVLCGAAVGVMTEAGRAGVSNPAEHGFSEILYAFSSASNNNGSAFAGLSANTPFYNTALGIVMLFARYWLAIPVLALAGAFAAAKRVPPSAGTLPTHTPLFVFVLISVVITVGALTFVPALALGPVVEHLLLFRPMTAVNPLQGSNDMATTLAARPTMLSWFVDKALLKRAAIDSFRRLTPRYQWRNPVMFVVYVGSLLTTVLWAHALTGKGEAPAGFILAVTLWLWVTLLFANFAEAIAEGRSKAQAASLKSARKDTIAKKLARAERGAPSTSVPSSQLRRGDLVYVEQGDLVPGDGEVIEGVASINESAITGESAPVIRAAGSDFNTVTGGTLVLSDWLIVRISVNPGEAFLDRMIGMVEGAKRQKTPNEIALTILLVAMTLVFLLATVTLLPYSIYSVDVAKAGTPVSITVLVALLVCLIPTTIGGLLSAIGVAGMGRMMHANVVATSGRAVEAAGDCDVLLLDKTGTITFGNRQASALHAIAGVNPQQLAEATLLASLGDETPEGKSIVALARRAFGLAPPPLEPGRFTIIPFTAQTRMSGVTFEGRELRKGALDAVRAWVSAQGGAVNAEVTTRVEEVARRGATPLVVAEGRHVLGVVELKDVVKTHIKERFAELRRMGIRTIMITGDNKLTAASIAAEAGVDDFLAEVTPEAKLKLIREIQADGKLVAMTGDGTNDAPALAQADVAVVMNSGTQAAKEAGNMVDLDSNPTKLIEIVEIGKQLLMTRGALTTFSIANDVAKYFAIIPAAFASTYPVLGALNVMQLATPSSAILSAVIFNALIIPALIPLALKGVKFRAVGAAAILRRNMLVYGVGGVVLPFVGIKLIDLLLVAVHLA